MTGAREIGRVRLRAHPARVYVSKLSKETLIALVDGQPWAIRDAARALGSEDLIFAARVMAAKLLGR